MKFMQVRILKLKNYFKECKLRTKIAGLSIILLLNASLSFCIKPHILLNENQILYLMSTMAQVIAGLFGLVLAAYAIIDPKLKEVGSKDEQLADSVEILRHKYFNNIIILSFMCAITIISCLFTLSLYYEISSKTIPILLNQSTLLCIGSIVLFLYFGCSLLNPNALSNLSKEELKNIEKEYGGIDKDFKPFVAYYNRLESLIIGYATELMNQELKLTVSYKYVDYKKKHIQIIQALEILGMRKIINRNIYNKIDELRRYRNALVHSLDDEKVNPIIFEELKSLYQKLYDVYQNKDNEDLWNQKRLELYQYGEQITLSEMDKMILEMIERDSNVTLGEIANNLEISKATASRKINLLLENQWIEKSKDGYFIKNKS
ncbi:hypothetical protein IO99_06060 [Clostridium sulfidigenes]|uniref:HTH marR-type domain-containing protein n=1 Tax=Clostridium sulfidigenes TaxID=318464 RepID=A0A084JEJ5_9CLOT|nr:helix-turn-helix domain-containing protein [Clostridium sulfidigenes]KEZ87379.1 hypothetical protein IO99_06060 [Clostridium sulfidigenes]